VSRDERQIIPDAGVEFHRVTCTLIMGSSSTAPASGPVVGGARAGDPVDPATGLFVYEKTDHLIPDVIPIVITRKYRQLDWFGRAFGPGTGLDYQMYWVGDVTTAVDLVLGDGAKIRYNRTSAGTSHTDAVMEHTASPTGFYKSVLSWDATPGAGSWCS
jgi:hypothetical protein